MSKPSPGFRINRPPSTSTSIHILDDDSLINIFRLYRPVLLDEDEANDFRILERGEWGRERWWYELAHVCRRWRILILTSTSHLDLCLFCTYNTPVEDILAHSPPLPLIVDYADGSRMLTMDDIQGIRLALQHHDRVRCIRLSADGKHLMHIVAPFMDEEFPMLEYLFIKPPDSHNQTVFARIRLPDTFRAPRLRHLVLIHVTVPAASPLLTTTAGIVTLSLNFDFGIGGYCHPNDLLNRLAPLLQLETLEIALPSYLSIHEWQQLHAPHVTHVTLPNLRWFGYKGQSNHLETLLPWMTTPLLENLQITFFDQLAYSLPCLLRYMSKADKLSFCGAKFAFNDKGVAVSIYPHEGARMSAFSLNLHRSWPGWQIFSVAEIFNNLSPLFSAVVELTIDFSGDIGLLESNEGAFRIQWRNLLRSFSGVRTLRVHRGVVQQLSRSLQPDGGQLLEILPELQVLVCHAEDNNGDAFTAFIDARNDTGHPVRLHVVVPDSPPASTSTSLRVRPSRLVRLWS